jgi:shikimate kinase
MAMNLVFIYGPPAVGKLTVAEELAKLTGYRLFHNHLALDLAREIYPEFGEQLFGLTHKLRLSVFEDASKTDTNLIYTMVYTDIEDDAFVASTIATVGSNGGHVYFVQLTAPDEEILKRVTNESRQRFRKLKDTAVLEGLLQKKGYRAAVTSSPSLVIDTHSTQPKEAASQIVQHFGL